jgi:hypothetical protein
LNSESHGFILLDFDYSGILAGFLILGKLIISDGFVFRPCCRPTSSPPLSASFETLIGNTAAEL